MNQRGGFLFFGCFLLIAGLAFVLVFALRGGFGASKYNCDLVELEPLQNTSLLRNQVSSDFTMIANFAGFIKFIHFVDEMVEKVLYLPLQLTGIRYKKFKDHNLLVLETDCANLEFLILQSGNTTTVKEVLTFWNKPYRSYDHCYVQTIKLDTPANEHYSCHKQRYYDCIHSTDIDVWDHIELATNQLEFEVDGQTDHLKLGRFSTDAMECTK